MAESKAIQVKVPQRTYEKLVQFTGSEGFVNGVGKPIVAQAVFKMIRFFLDTEHDPEWEKLREKTGGNTFGMVDSAVIEHIKKRQRGPYCSVYTNFVGRVEARNPILLMIHGCM